jgi:TonB family protein
MTMRVIAFLLVLTIAGSVQAGATGLTETRLPAATGQPHVCDQGLYPVAAMQAKVEGTTLLAFTVGSDGNVAGVAVKTSSGNADLDAASVACAKAWQYQPAWKDGVAVDMPWQARVVWKMPDPAAPPFDAMFRATQACVANERAENYSEPAATPTVLRVKFSRGAVKTVEVAASSGNRDLDRLAANCWINVPPDLSAPVQDGYTMVFPVDWSVRR